MSRVLSDQTGCSVAHAGLPVRGVAPAMRNNVLGLRCRTLLRVSCRCAHAESRSAPAPCRRSVQLRDNSVLSGVIGSASTSSGARGCSHMLKEGRTGLCHSSPSQSEQRERFDRAPFATRRPVPCGVELARARSCRLTSIRRTRHARAKGGVAGPGVEGAPVAEREPPVAQCTRLPANDDPAGRRCALRASVRNSRSEVAAP